MCLSRHPVVTPIFFFLVPVGFFLALYLAGISRQQAAASGWLFSFEPSSSKEAGEDPSWMGLDPRCLAFPGVVQYCLRPWLVDWGLALDFLFPMAGIVFFSVVHVPVNV